MVEETFARLELVEGYRRAAALGLNPLASGNLSVRLRDGLLISPTGATAETLTEEALVVIDGSGRWDPSLRPSSEWRMHAAIYANNPDASAVVHTHSDHCVAVACQNKPLPGFHYLVGVFGGNDVPCVPYFTFGGEDLANAASAALLNRNACLLANHGMIARGPTLKLALDLAQRLEILCRQYVLARQLGEPQLLSSEQWREFHAKSRAARYRN